MHVAGRSKMPLHLQGMLLVKQMALTDTQASASRVSLLTMGQQAIMDAYLCLLHLTTGKLCGWCLAWLACLLHLLASVVSGSQGGVLLGLATLLMLLLTPAACAESSAVH